MFRNEKDNKSLSQHYVNFNRFYGGAKGVILYPTGWEKNAEPIRLANSEGGLSSEYTLALPHVIAVLQLTIYQKHHFLRSGFSKEL